MQLIFPVFVGLLCAQLGESAELSLRDSYNIINDRLTKKVASEDLEANMQEAAEWLEELESNRYLTLHRGRTRSMITALELLLNLRSLSKPEVCDSTSDQIVNENNKFAWIDDYVYVKKPSRRIEWIVYHYSKEYYNMCHPDIIGKRYEQLNEKTRTFLSNIEKIDVASSPQPIERDCLQVVRKNLYIDFARSHDKTPADRFPNYRVSEDDYLRFLIEPCKELKRKLGDEFDKDKIFNIIFYDKSLDQWYEAIAQRTTVNNCRTILNFEKELYSFMVKRMDQEDEKISSLRGA